MIHPRVTLVHAEVVATLRGVSREAIYDAVDGADGTGDSFMWVFNVCASAQRERELRFWSPELNAPETVRGLNLEEVIRRIVPRRDVVPGQFCGMPNWQVRDLLRVSRRTMLDLRDELQAVPHQGGIYVPRAGLESFFRRRWCFANCVGATSKPK